MRRRRGGGSWGQKNQQKLAMNLKFFGSFYPKLGIFASHQISNNIKLRTEERRGSHEIGKCVVMWRGGGATHRVFSQRCPWPPLARQAVMFNILSVDPLNLNLRLGVD